MYLQQGNLDESGEEEERQERDKVRGSARGQLFTNMSTAEEVTSSTQQASYIHLNLYNELLNKLYTSFFVQWKLFYIRLGALSWSA